MALSSWRATAPVLAAAVALLVAGAAAQPPACMLDCPGIGTVEDVCAYFESVQDNQCIADCDDSVLQVILEEADCDGGPPECALDCPGIDSVDDVCAYLESVQDNQCIADCADSVLQGIIEENDCDGNSAASLASHVVLVSLAAAVALLA